MKTSINCYDCEHECDDHGPDGCTFSHCPCTESRADLISLATSHDPKGPS